MNRMNPSTPDGVDRLHESAGTSDIRPRQIAISFYLAVLFAALQGAYGLYLLWSTRRTSGRRDG